MSLFLLLLSCQFILISISSATNSSIDARDEPPNDLWWVDGQPIEDDLSLELRQVIERLGKSIFIDKRADMRAVYGSCFWNPSNSTLFIVLTDCHVESLALFDQALSPPSSVHIIYREGPATYVNLERYVEMLREKLSLLGSVKMNSLGITENATILIGVHEVTPAVVEAIENIIHGVVPEDLVIIRKMDEKMTTGEILAYSLVPASIDEVANPKHTESPGPIRTARDSTDDKLIITDYWVTFVALLIPLALLMLAKKSLSR